MHRLIKPIFWTILFLIMMLAIDQFLVQVPPVHPAHAAVSNFYRDLRGRLIDLAFNEQKEAPESIEAVIEQQQRKEKTEAKKPVQPDQKKAQPPTAPQPEKSQRYIYSDSKGELQFADSLEAVPAEYRKQAQPMGQ